MLNADWDVISGHNWGSLCNGSHPPWGEGYSHIRTIRVLPRESPHFSALAAPKDCTFSTWAAPNDHLFKKLQFFVPLFRPLQIEKTLVLKKIYLSLLFLAPKSPAFPVRGRSESRLPLSTKRSPFREKDSFSRKGLLLSRKGACCIGSGRFHGNYLSV